MQRHVEHVEVEEVVLRENAVQTEAVVIVVVEVEEEEEEVVEEEVGVEVVAAAEVVVVAAAKCMPDLFYCSNRLRFGQISFF